MDVRLIQTENGGDIVIGETVSSGGFSEGPTLPARVEMETGPETAAYLSLFSGNEDDAGTDATKSKQWWGNVVELDETRRLRSETQHLLHALPATSSNIPKIAEAVGRDLAWMEDALGAEIGVTVTMPGINQVKIVVSIVVDGEQFGITAIEQWGDA